MLLAGVFFALMNVSVKFIPHIPAIEIILFRSIFSLIFSYVFLKNQKIPVFGNNKKLLVIRGIVGSVGLIGFFYTLQKIPLASAVTIQYLSPIFTTILGIFLVKEKVKPIQFLYFFISFAGVLVIQGFDPRIDFFYAGIGIIAALFSGLAYNVIRKLKNTEHPLVIIFYFPLVTLPVATLISYFTWVQPIGWDWLILLWIGICTQAAQYFMTVAYQNANVSKISSLSYLGILYALFFGFVLFGETFGIMSYVGMGLVLIGILLNLREK
ncbi:EamA domain-containing membrane protein RarD [Algoriphagus ornithinivorans]|uniref:EamA domain-containing membrane protein RarD n=1 Tax=Algoriphagus ornithinivorans TaxID=226506 RepID=A0A1I5BXV0_9BACT|nr:DMT family transporter [Algoriphagus ornithinivorans]SFN79568.1 EamA domain-containing membrane protein RarD [Algoriphagus ornithinivorans]